MDFVSTNMITKVFPGRATEDADHTLDVVWQDVIEEHVPAEDDADTPHNRLYFILIH